MCSIYKDIYYSLRLGRFKKVLLTKKSKIYEETLHIKTHCNGRDKLEKVAIMSCSSPETHGIGIELVYFVIDYCLEYRDRLYLLEVFLQWIEDIVTHLEKQYSDIAAIKLHPVHQNLK